MFLKGHITEDLESILNDLFILGKTGNKILLPAILDTGFNGELALPIKFKTSCNFTPLDSSSVTSLQKTEMLRWGVWGEMGLSPQFEPNRMLCCGEAD